VINDKIYKLGLFYRERICFFMCEKRTNLVELKRKEKMSVNRIS